MLDWKKFRQLLFKSLNIKFQFFFVFYYHEKVSLSLLFYHYIMRKSCSLCLAFFPYRNNPCIFSFFHLFLLFVFFTFSTKFKCFFSKIYTKKKDSEKSDKKKQRFSRNPFPSDSLHRQSSLPNFSRSSGSRIKSSWASLPIMIAVFIFAS